jgi:hypothetical protein
VGGNKHRVVFVLKGPLVDVMGKEQKYSELPGAFMVEGMERTYVFQKSELPGMVCVVAPFDLSGPLKRARAAEYRTWTDPTGKFTVEAKFGGIVNGKVNLVTKDGRKIQVEPENLSAADQAFLKEIVDK